ncbi:hypothetical protein YC2023_006840 [Brassica napus]
MELFLFPSSYVLLLNHIILLEQGMDAKISQKITLDKLTNRPTPISPASSLNYQQAGKKVKAVA